MGAKKYIPFKKQSTLKNLLHEKYLLEHAYDFLDVKIISSSLNIKGYCRPTEYSKTYEYKINFSYGRSPNVHVINPQIEYHDDIHMYSEDKSLCLYYPKDNDFTIKSHLVNTIIPWTHEWFLYYELYLLKGAWLHPHVNHKKI